VRKPQPFVLGLLAKLGIVPEDVPKAAALLNDGGDGLSLLGKEGAITPQYYVLAVKPELSPEERLARLLKEDSPEGEEARRKKKEEEEERARLQKVAEEAAAQELLQQQAKETAKRVGENRNKL
jgi:hypothetical protein